MTNEDNPIIEHALTEIIYLSLHQDSLALRSLIESVYDAGADQALNQLVTTAWIPITTTLPPLNQKILVAVAGTDIVVIARFDGLNYRPNQYIANLKPTHWMPLPRLPKA